jgi:hypothetical protein
MKKTLIGILLICSLVYAQDTNIISLSSASEFYNGKCIPDSIVLHHVEFISLIGILKLTEDSLKTNTIMFDKNSLNFIYKTSLLSHEQLVQEIIKTRNEFRNVYVFYCLQMIETLKNYETINKNSIEEIGRYFGVGDLLFQ